MAKHYLEPEFWDELSDKNSCCFFGQRRAMLMIDIKEKLLSAMYEHISYNHVDNFYFLPNDQFNRLCYNIIPEKKSRCLLVCKKERFSLGHTILCYDSKPNLEAMDYSLRNYGDIDYCDFVLQNESDHYRRNKALVDKCSCCIFYYDPKQDCTPTCASASDSEDYMSNHLIKQTYFYAMQQGKKIINICDKEKYWY